MKAVALAVSLIALLIQRPLIIGSVMCVGAEAAVVRATAATLQHQEPPADWLCSRQGFIKNGQRTADHPCACHAIATADSACEQRIEDYQCLTYCKSNGTNCTCPSHECR